MFGSVCPFFDGPIYMPVSPKNTQNTKKKIGEMCSLYGNGIYRFGVTIWKKLVGHERRR